jgi:hypothetical protein
VFSLADVLDDFEISITHKRYTKNKVNFVETVIEEFSRSVRAVVQPASMETLKALSINEQLVYLSIYSKADVSIGDYFVIKGKVFRVVQTSDYSLWGFDSSIAEEHKGVTI